MIAVARGTVRRLGIDRPRQEGKIGGFDPLRQAVLRITTMFKPPIVESPPVQAGDDIRARTCAHCGYWQTAAWRFGPLGATTHACVRDETVELIAWADA